MDYKRDKLMEECSHLQLIMEDSLVEVEEEEDLNNEEVAIN